MSDSNPSELQQEISNLKDEVESVSAEISVSSLGDSIDLEEMLFYLWKSWADFSLTVTFPSLPEISPPQKHLPRKHSDGTLENVLVIHDYGPKLSTSRGEEAFSPKTSFYKFYNTIDKMVNILLEKLKNEGIAAEEEVRVAFSGFELGCRKAFESVLNLEENVLVVNYDPGKWGDLYMKNVLAMVERGYGMPKSSPRTDF